MKTKELLLFVFFIDYNMEVKYRLSTDYDHKKEIFLKTYNGGILINNG